MDYEGDFVNNVRTGEGKVRWPNGDGYEGTFLNDDPTGKGTYFYQAGWSFDEIEGILTITKDLRFKTHMFDTIRDRVFSVTASKGARITNGFDLFWGMKGLSEVDLSELDVSACENMCGMFRSCPSLTELDLRNWNTDRVKDVSQMFDECVNLQKVRLGGWNTKNVTTMRGLFEDCKRLEVIDLSGWQSSGADTQDMFKNVPSTVRVICDDADILRLVSGGNGNGEEAWAFSSDHLTLYLNGELPDWGEDLPPWYESFWASQIERVVARPGAKARTCREMFSGCRNLKAVYLQDLDVSEVTNMSGMFRECKSLDYIDLKNLKTSKVTVMTSVFQDCEMLREADLSGWDVSSVKSFSYFFCRCGSLEEVRLGGWNVDEKAYMDGFTKGCVSLRSEHILL
jgi:surface protein